MSEGGVDVAAVDVPAEVTAEFREAGPVDGGSMTLADALDAVECLVSDEERGMVVERFFQDEQTRHEVSFGERVEHVPCVLDALIVAELVESPVRIRSTPPGDGDAVRFCATDAGVAVDPATAVVSFGLSADRAADPGMDPFESMESGSVVLCSYINAFPSRRAYERWSEGLDDGCTMALSMETALALAAEAAESWAFDA